MYKGSAQKVFLRSACASLREATLRSSNGEDERVLGSEEFWAMISDIERADGAAALLGLVGELISQIQSQRAQGVAWLREED